MTYYLLLTGSLAFIWIYGIGFNLGTVALILIIAALIGLAVIGNRRNQRQREQTYGQDSSQSTASEEAPEQRS
jgi:lactate permease